MGLLDGHRALVTGGGSGIGRATCRRFAAEGAQVAVLDVNADAAAAVAAEVGGTSYAVDVAEAEQVREAVARAAADLGGLSVLLANAGIGTMGAIGETRVDEWQQILAVNLSGVFYTVQAALPHLVSSGDARVVCTASISGVRPAEGEAAYAATKAGVAAFVASLALEYAPTLRANAIAPGMIATTLTSPLLDNFPSIVEKVLAKTPLARIGTPEEVADVVLFLCSDLSRFVTGQNIVIDGGMTLHGSGVDGWYRELTGRTPPPAPLA